MATTAQRPVNWRTLCRAWLAALLVGAMGHTAAVASHHELTVLVLYSNSRLLPATIDGDRGLRQAIRASTERPLLVLDEFLDMPRMGGQAYEDTVRTYLHDKYAPRPPDVVIAGGDSALEFLLKYRDELFPGLTVVHMSVTKGFLRSAEPLPAGVVGVPIDLEFARTIEQALSFHPRARRVVVITGASPPDRAWEARLRSELPRFEPRATAEFWAAVPRDELLNRLGELRPDSVVFTPGFFEDGEGRAFTPRESAAAIAAASAAPVYVPFNTFIGTGVVGGVVPSFEAIGRQAGEIVNALLAGAEPASLALPQLVPTALALDWRQVQRWGIDEAAIPRGAVLQFKEPTLWQAHRGEVLAVAVVFALQSGLIGLLVFERRRRQRAERVANRQRAEFAHASRLALAGELTGSIAHEINQPLGAILSNAETAELLLESGADRRDELRRILADIRRDDLRASEVIRRLRGLLARHEVEREPIDLNDVVRDMESLISAEVRRRRMVLDVRLAPTAQTVLGDRIQIQQVLINLVLNGMDAMARLGEPRRTVEVAVQGQAGGSRITVRDRGPGIAAADLPKVFESFFSTKRKGMGLGLSIARTLVEAHGGRIRADNGAEDGAVFQIDFPAAGATLQSEGIGS
jgi:signal transduction histidine kinase